MENERRQLEGEIFHRLVQQYWLGLPVEKLSRLANSPELSQWWSNYLDYDFKLDGFATFPEMTLTAPVGNHKLTAKYDLVAVGADKVIIFDWKTYQKKPKETNLAVCYQTRVYRSLMVKAGGCLNSQKPFEPEQIEMMYWLANFPDQPIQYPYSSIQSKRDWQHMTQVISRIETTRDFSVTPDEKKCNYCMYRSYCDRGISAPELDDYEQEPQLEMSALTLDGIQEIEF
jgi:hypothetical protein